MLRTPVGTDLRSIFPDYSICCSVLHICYNFLQLIFSSSSRCWSPVSEAAAISERMVSSRWFRLVICCSRRVCSINPAVPDNSAPPDTDRSAAHRHARPSDQRPFQIVQIEHGPFFHQRSVTVPDGIVGNIGF